MSEPHNVVILQSHARGLAETPTVGLNVKAGNASAIRMDERFGFGRVLPCDERIAGPR